MGYAEVIYEPGSKSVVHYDSLDELKAGLKNHHTRAINGEVNGEQGGPSERVHKVLTYEEHPGDYGDDGKVSTDAVNTLVEGMASGKDTLDANQLISALRDEMSPTFPQDQGRHKSMYKADGNELDLAFLDSGDSDA